MTGKEDAENRSSRNQEEETHHCRSDNIEHNVQETLDNLDSYYMEASMEFYKGEDTRKYVVKVSYKDDENDLFRVSMYDKTSEQEQIILKNNDGVYVLTPALNQAYKFKGDWPLNGHKPYLYQFFEYRYIF